VAGDLATLSLALSNDQAIAGAKATGQAFDEMGAKGEAAAAKIAASSNPVTEAIKQQAIDYTSLTARIEDFARAGANASQIQQMTGSSLAQAMTAIKAYSGTIAKAEIDVGGLRAAQAQMALVNMVPGIERTTDSTRRMTLAQMEAIAMNEKMGQGFSMAGTNVGRLRQSFASAIATMTGISPIAARIASTLGVMVAGVGEVVLGLAAIAAVVWVWDKMTEGANKAAAAADAAAKKTSDALHAHVLGGEGQIAEAISGTLDKIADLQHQRDMAASAMAALKGGSLQAFNLNPADRAIQLKAMDDEIAMLKMAVKSGETDMQLAKVKSDVTNVTTPYDYALKRGQSISGFYAEAMAAEVKLTALAKSGTGDVKNSALDALEKIKAVLDHLTLIKMGLAEKPSQVVGLPSDVALGGIKTTGGNLSSEMATAARHGEDLSIFSKQVLDFVGLTAGALDKQGPKWSSVKQQLQEAADQAQILADATILAAGGGEKYAASIRNRPSNTASAGALDNAQAQAKYGESLAQREAALKLPQVFDADREAVLRHGETMRKLTQEFDVAMQAFKSVRAAVDSFKEGLHAAAAHFAEQFKPANVAENLLNKVAGDTSSVGGSVGGGIGLAVGDFFGGPIGAAIGGAIGSRLGNMVEGLFGGGSAAKHAAQAAADAQKGIANQLDTIAAQLAHNTLAATLLQLQGSLDQELLAINSALPGKKNEAQRNADRDRATQLEAQQEQRAKEDYARAQQYATEDLAVENLRATGQGDAANLLAFKEQQQREYTQAILDGRDATYLNTLATTQNNKLMAFLNGTLKDAINQLSG
jgi:hypothetical protein